ncbi:MAG: hypothetical protein PVI57_11890, partial [Gemmatimonadota bacterium]
LFSRALMTPLLGLGLALILAYVMEHRVFLRTLGTLSGLSTLILLAVVVLFALDTVQMRAQVRPEANLAFDVASVTAAVKMVLVALTTLAFAWGGWSAPRALDRAASQRKRSAAAASGAGAPLVGGGGG